MRFVIIKDISPNEIQERTAVSISKELEKIGKVEILNFGVDIFDLLKKSDAVFNLAIGKRHDFLQGSVASTLESLQIPFIGSPAYTHYVCLDKFTAKAVLGASGILTPEGCLFDGKEFSSELPAPPLMVKPSAEGSGIGIDSKSLCFGRAEALETAGKLHERFGEPVLIERYIDGPELTVGIVGGPENPFVLPAVEIDFSNLPPRVERYYSSEVKEKHADSTVYRCPPVSVGKPSLEAIGRIAVKAFRAVRARDYIRIDMRIEKGVPYVIEINSMPGLDPVTSDIPKMLGPLSKGYGWLISRIAERVLSEKESG